MVERCNHTYTRPFNETQIVTARNVTLVTTKKKITVKINFTRECNDALLQSS